MEVPLSSPNDPGRNDQPHAKLEIAAGFDAYGAIARGDAGATKRNAMLVAPTSRRRWWCAAPGWFHRPRGRGRYKISNHLVAQASPPAMGLRGEAGTSTSCRFLQEADDLGRSDLCWARDETR